MKTYILLKDLPDSLAGTEYEPSYAKSSCDKEFFYQPCSNKFNKNGININVLRDRKIPATWVENSPDWFKLKEEKSNIEIVDSVPVKDGKIESIAYKDLDKSKIRSGGDNFPYEILKNSKAENVLLDNGFSFSRPDGTGVVKAASSHQIYYFGDPKVMINGEGYLPLKETIDILNKSMAPIEVDQLAIDNAKKILLEVGYTLFDYNKKWTDNDMKTCWAASRDISKEWLATFEDYINSINK